MTVRISNRERTQMKEVAGEKGPRGGMCAGREGNKRPGECPTSAGKPERYRNTGGVLVCEVSQQLQCCAMGAPRIRQWNSRSTAAAAEGGSTHDRKRGRCWRRAGCDLDVN